MLFLVGGRYSRILATRKANEFRNFRLFDLSYASGVFRPRYSRRVSSSGTGRNTVPFSGHQTNRRLGFDFNVKTLPPEPKPCRKAKNRKVTGDTLVIGRPVGGGWRS